MKPSRVEAPQGSGVRGRAGRTFWSEEQARELLSEQQSSGRAIAEFARERGVSAKRLYWWKRQLALRSRVIAAEGPSFLPVRVVATKASRTSAAPASSPPSSATSSSLEVVLGAGRVVRVGSDFDAALLRRVVRALEQEGSC